MITPNDYRKGFEDGVRCFAWWKDGTQYVGTTGTTLERALAGVENRHGFLPPKEDRCEDCNSELSDCGEQGVDGIPSTDCKPCQLRDKISKLESDSDMQRDEFKRIIALLPRGIEWTQEITGICERAIIKIEQTVPVVVQRDKLQSDNVKLRNALAGLVGADGAELDGMEALIRISPVADQDRAVTINAIHALRETL